MFGLGGFLFNDLYLFLGGSKGALRRAARLFFCWKFLRFGPFCPAPRPVDVRIPGAEGGL